MSSDRLVNILKVLGKEDFNINLLVKDQPAIKLNIKEQEIYIDILNLVLVGKIIKALMGINLLTIPRQLSRHMSNIRKGFKVKFGTGEKGD